MNVEQKQNKRLKYLFMCIITIISFLMITLVTIKKRRHKVVLTPIPHHHYHDNHHSHHHHPSSLHVILESVVSCEQLNRLNGLFITSQCRLLSMSFCSFLWLHLLHTQTHPKISWPKMQITNFPVDNIVQHLWQQFFYCPSSSLSLLLLLLSPLYDHCWPCQTAAQSWDY